MHSFHGSYSNRGSGAKRASSDAAARSLFSQEEKKEWGAHTIGKLCKPVRLPVQSNHHLRTSIQMVDNAGHVARAEAVVDVHDADPV